MLAHDGVTCLGIEPSMPKREFYRLPCATSAHAMKLPTEDSNLDRLVQSQESYRLNERGTMGTPIPTSQTYGIRTRAYYLDRVAL